jgi:hypothetical protein
MNGRIDAPGSSDDNVGAIGTLIGITSRSRILALLCVDLEGAVIFHIATTALVSDAVMRFAAYALDRSIR